MVSEDGGTSGRDFRYCIVCLCSRSGAAEPSGGRPGVPDRLRRAGEGTSPDCSMSQSNRRKVGLPVSDAMISRLLEPSEFEFGIHLSR